MISELNLSHYTFFYFVLVVRSLGGPGWVTKSPWRPHALSWVCVICSVFDFYAHIDIYTRIGMALTMACVHFMVGPINLSTMNGTDRLVAGHFRQLFWWPELGYLAESALPSFSTSGVAEVPSIDRLAKQLFSKSLRFCYLYAFTTTECSDIITRGPIGYRNCRLVTDAEISRSCPVSISTSTSTSHV